MLETLSFARMVQSDLGPNPGSIRVWIVAVYPGLSYLVTLNFRFLSDIRLKIISS